MFQSSRVCCVSKKTVFEMVKFKLRTKYARVRVHEESSEPRALARTKASPHRLWSRHRSGRFMRTLHIGALFAGIFNIKGKDFLESMANPATKTKGFGGKERRLRLTRSQILSVQNFVRCRRLHGHDVAIVANVFFFDLNLSCNIAAHELCSGSLQKSP